MSSRFRGSLAAAGVFLAAGVLLTATCSRKPLEKGSEVDASVGGSSGGAAGAGGGITIAGGGTGGGIAGAGGTASAGGEAGTAAGTAGIGGGMAGAAAGASGTAGAAGASGAAGAGGACAAGSCGPQPPEAVCNDGGGPAFNCLREADGACRWHRGSCGVDCRAIGGDAVACGRTVDCMFLMPGCSRPSIPKAGCYDRADVDSVCHPFACAAPKICQSVKVDSCTLATGRLEASACADGVCRDQIVIVCTTGCSPGADQTCNDNPGISSTHGTCTSTGTCVCSPGFSMNPSTGRCL